MPRLWTRPLIPSPPSTGPPIHVAVDGLDDPAQRPGLTPLLRLGCGWAVAVGLSLQRSAAEAGSSDHRRSLCPST